MKYKEPAASMFAILCDQSSIFGKWADIKDDVTGAKLAGYSEWGFREY